MVYYKTWDPYNGLLYFVIIPTWLGSIPYIYIYTLNNLIFYIAQWVPQLAPFGANHPHHIAHLLVIQ